MDESTEATYYEAVSSEIDPLMTPAERELFEQLQTAAARNAFLSEFWRHRDPTPATDENEALNAWRRNTQEARRYFPDLEGDRARAMLLAGAPTLTAAFRGCGGAKPLEIWFYSDEVTSFYLLFVDSQEETPLLWWPEQGRDELLHDERWRNYDLDKLVKRFDRAVQDGCTYEHRGTSRFFEKAVQEALGWDQLLAASGLQSKNDQWVRAFAPRLEDDSVSTASGLAGAEVEVSTGGDGEGQRYLEGKVRLPLAEMGVEELTELAALQLSLEGELWHAGSRVDLFRYTFHSVALDETQTAALLPFYRSVTAGEYALRLEVRGPQGLLLDRFSRIEVPAHGEVPSNPTSPGSSTLSEGSNIEVFDSYHSIQLLPPESRLLVDEVEISTLTTGAGVRTVELWLNNKRVARIDQPPFRAKIDVGPEPREHRLEAVALGENGEALARDRLDLNAGRHHFGVRLLEPHGLQQPGTEVRAVAQVDLPEGGELDRVELYLDDTLLTTLHQPPFIYPFSIPEADWTTTYVRAVAYLEDGRTAEDLQLVQARGEFDEIDVQLVELYATVTRGDRLIMDLQRDDFQILEAGKVQKIERFERMDNLPINVVVLMDTSLSMRTAIAPATASALSFIDSVLTERDQAAFIRFNHVSELVTPFTHSLERLRLGVSGLSASGGTRLYDSLIQAMFYFSGIEGKRALVLLSDGYDEHSHFDFENVVEYALRSGVAVYAIALQGGTRDLVSNKKLREELTFLAENTGGRFFRARSLGELDYVYEQIQRELRSQYLLTYYSPEGKEGLRRVTLEVDGSSTLQVKTRQGYIRR